MTRMSPVVLVFGLLTILAPTAEARSAREILDAMKAVNDAREPADMHQKMKMTLVDSRGGERVRDLEMYAKTYDGGEDKAVSFFLSPPEVRGVGFLSWGHPDADDDQWLYLPALKRVRRITANTRRQSFQGSDFTYEDLELFDEMPDWTEEDAASELVEDGATVDGVETVVIDLRPKKGDYEYGRFRIWVNEGDATIRKIEFHSKKDDTLLKTLAFEDVRMVGKVPTPHRLDMVNHKKGTKTLLELSDVRYDQGLSDDVFTERTLERGKVR